MSTDWKTREEPTPEDFPKPGPEETGTIEGLESTGFLVIEEQDLGAEAYPGQVWWGPFYYSGGFVDATTYFQVPVQTEVKSFIGFYNSSGSRVAYAGWYSHGVRPLNSTVGRRWRGYIPPTAVKAIAWWSGGGMYASPTRWFR